MSRVDIICVTTKLVNTGLNSRYFWKINRIKWHAIPAHSSREMGLNMSSMYVWSCCQTYYGFNWSFLKWSEQNNCMHLIDIWWGVEMLSSLYLFWNMRKCKIKLMIWENLILGIMNRKMFQRKQISSINLERIH